jgi:hypothetical protein
VHSTVQHSTTREDAPAPPRRGCATDVQAFVPAHTSPAAVAFITCDMEVLVTGNRAASLRGQSEYPSVLGIHARQDTPSAKSDNSLIAIAPAWPSPVIKFGEAEGGGERDGESRRVDVDEVKAGVMRTVRMIIMIMMLTMTMQKQDTSLAGPSSLRGNGQTKKEYFVAISIQFGTWW